MVGQDAQARPSPAASQNGWNSEASRELPGYNFRDVAAVDPARLSPGLVFRSSEVFDLATLKNLNIIVAVDLRLSSLHDKHRAKRGHEPHTSVLSAPSSAADLKDRGQKLRKHSESNPTVAAGRFSLKKLGIHTYKVACLRPRAKLLLFWWTPRPVKWQVLRTVLTCGSAQQVMGPIVADPKYIGYVRLYCLILDTAKPYIHHVLKIMSHTENLPLVVHCTHGKDRTGLIVALLLLLLGVEEEAVIKDYAMSFSELKEKREEITQAGYIDIATLDDDMISSPEDTMRQVLNHLREAYDGIDGYLKAIGLTSKEFQRIRKLILRPDVFASEHNE